MSIRGSLWPDRGTLTQCAARGTRVVGLEVDEVWNYSTLQAVRCRYRPYPAILTLFPDNPMGMCPVNHRSGKSVYDVALLLCFYIIFLDSVPLVCQENL